MNQAALYDQIPLQVEQLFNKHGNFYQFVPKEREENLLFRETLNSVSHMPLIQVFLREMCARDPLFWLNTYCWVFEPRPDGEDGYGRLPFITWPGQDKCVHAVMEHWGTSDMVVDKSRGEGASWVFLMLILHAWLFNDEDKMFSAGLASRNMDAVDNHRDPDSLMWKLDFQLKQLPQWMAGEKDSDWGRFVSDHSLVNYRLGHTITGYSADDDLGTGGRKTVWFWDEMSKFPVGKDQDALNSTEPTSNCRIMVSTHKGTANEYYKIVRNPGSTPLIVMDWKDNPSRNERLFTVPGGIKTGTPTLIDADEQGAVWDAFLDVWPEKSKELDSKAFEWADDKVVSPWYIERCLRAGSSPQTMAQEYDRNPEGTEQQFFSEARLERVKKETIRPPRARGYLKFDYDNPLGDVVFIPDPEGQVLVWCDMLAHSPLLTGDACIGCDISSGLGDSRTSNSVAIAFDRQSGKQIMEFATNRLLPNLFASYSMALANWLHRAQLNWETNGTNGKAFTKTVISTGYYNLYFRENTDRISKKKTKQIGWGSSGKTKSDILGGTEGGGLRGAVYEGACKVHSQALLDEMKQFIYDDSGQVVHSGSLNRSDNANKNEAHGDRVIAAAVAWLTVMDRPKKSLAQLDSAKDKPQDTMAWRLDQHDRALLESKQSGWTW